jgi:hypothetical protein
LFVCFKFFLLRRHKNKKRPGTIATPEEAIILNNNGRNNGENLRTINTTINKLIQPTMYGVSNN